MYKIKILNLLTYNGKKKKSENILLKIFKNLQKFSSKHSKKIIKLALIFSTPFFKIHKIINKKRKYIKQIPTIIINEKTRISLAIKFILKNIKNKKSNDLSLNFYNDIFLIAQNQGLIVQKKNELQKQVLLLKKHFFFFYR
jgi:ribosomal protein S7